jgi:hypothetical protein
MMMGMGLRRNVHSDLTTMTSNRSSFPLSLSFLGGVLFYFSLDFFSYKENINFIGRRNINISLKRLKHLKYDITGGHGLPGEELW